MASFVDSFPRGMGGDLPNQLSATSRWATDLELRRFPYDGKSQFVLGLDPQKRLIGYRDDRHAVTVAGSRAGKGVSVIVPALCQYPGSMVAIDPKGELATLTAARRGAGSAYCIGMGQDVFVLDPFGVSSRESAQFNPLAGLNRENEETIEDAAMLADALIMDETGPGAHWSAAAKNLIRGLILHVVSFDEPENRHLIRVYEYLTGTVKPFADVLREMAENDHFRDAVKRAAISLQEKSEAERSGVLSTAREQLSFLDSPGMRRVLVGSSFQLEDLKTSWLNSPPRGTTVYLCLPAARMGTHARWLRLMISLALSALEREQYIPPLPVTFMLDEFAALGHMQPIEVAAGQLAGSGVKLWAVLQDLTQLQRNYKEGWETFLGNAGLLQFFGNTDLTTLEHASKRLGTTETRSVSFPSIAQPTEPDWRLSVSTAPLLHPEEVGYYFARDRGTVLTMIPGERPMALWRIKYHEHTAYNGLWHWDERLNSPAPPRLR